VRRPSLRVIGFACFSLVVYVVVRTIVHPAMIDFAIYRIEGDAVRHGIDLYSHLNTPQDFQATYPPFAAVLFVPISLIPWLASQVLANAVNIGLIWFVSWQSCRLMQVPEHRLPDAALLLAAISIWAEPVYTTLGNGQINLVLLALVLADFLRSEDSRWRGIGIGIATGIKVTPGVFVIYLLLTRRFRMAATAVVGFAVTLAISAAVVPSDTWRFWTKILFDTSRVGELANSTNQSGQGLLARATRSVDLASGWALLAGVVAIGVLAAAVFAYRRLGDAWGLPVAAVAGLLGSPIAWTHHWVWCIPITVLVLTRLPRWSPIVLIFWTFALFYFPHKAPQVLQFPDWKLALTQWYVLFGIVFVALAVVVARRSAAPVPEAHRSRPDRPPR
jgi:alpha-1,2-mannosyltransferase